MGAMPIVVEVRGGLPRPPEAARNREAHAMNIFTNHPDAALTVAHRTIADRVDDAQVRTRTRALRTDQRLTRHTTRGAR